MASSLVIRVSDELLEAVEQARNSYNARKLVNYSRTRWAETVIADAVRAELDARAEAEAEIRPSRAYTIDPPHGEQPG